jgi:hypothetical protein
MSILSHALHASYGQKAFGLNDMRRFAFPFVLSQLHRAT